jgi:uncharacterized protein YjcR
MTEAVEELQMKVDELTKLVESQSDQLQALLIKVKNQSDALKVQEELVSKFQVVARDYLYGPPAIWRSRLKGLLHSDGQ